MDDLITLKSMPQSAREIAEYLGLDAARIISQHYGGTTLYVPMTWHADLELNQTLGVELAKALIKNFNGDCIKPPIKLMNSKERRRLVFALSRAGMTQDKIARRLNITQRWVEMIVSQGETYGHNRPDKSPTLFPELF